MDGFDRMIYASTTFFSIHHRNIWTIIKIFITHQEVSYRFFTLRTQFWVFSMKILTIVKDEPYGMDIEVHYNAYLFVS